MANNRAGRVLWAYYSLRARISWWWRMNVLGWWCFVRLGWRLFRGELVWISTEDGIANGGYKYRVITLSKRPLAEDATYDF